MVRITIRTPAQRRVGGDPAGRLQPVHAGHADVHEHDVGPFLRGQAHGLRAVGRLADDRRCRPGRRAAPGTRPAPAPGRRRAPPGSSGVPPVDAAAWQARPPRSRRPVARAGAQRHRRAPWPARACPRCRCPSAGPLGRRPPVPSSTTARSSRSGRYSSVQLAPARRRRRGGARWSAPPARSGTRPGRPRPAARRAPRRRSGVTGRPASATRSSTSASPGAGCAAPPRPAGAAPPSTARTSRSASALACLIAASAARACSGCSSMQVQPDAGLHVDQRQVVAEHVVQFLGDPQPLLAGLAALLLLGCAFSSASARSSSARARAIAANWAAPDPVGLGEPVATSVQAPTTAACPQVTVCWICPAATYPTNATARTTRACHRCPPAPRRAARTGRQGTRGRPGSRPPRRPPWPPPQPPAHRPATCAAPAAAPRARRAATGSPPWVPEHQRASIRSPGPGRRSSRHPGPAAPVRSTAAGRPRMAARVATARPPTAAARPTTRRAGRGRGRAGSSCLKTVGHRGAGTRRPAEARDVPPRMYAVRPRSPRVVSAMPAGGRRQRPPRAPRWGTTVNDLEDPT